MAMKFGPLTRLCGQSFDGGYKMALDARRSVEHMEAGKEMMDGTNLWWQVRREISNGSFFTNRSHPCVTSIRENSFWSKRTSAATQPGLGNRGNSGLVASLKVPRSDIWGEAHA